MGTNEPDGPRHRDHCPFLVEVLDTAENTGVVEALRVAKAWGVPPLTVMAGRPNKWRPEDTLLARALIEYEATCVNELGFPKRVSEDRTNAKKFKVEDRKVDYALRAWDEYQAAQQKTKRKLPPGVRPTVVYKP